MPGARGGHLFFEEGQQLRRLDLRTGAETVLVEGEMARCGALAVGGGWLYWRAPWRDRALRCHPLH